jgi:hypothetical protein
MIPIRTEMRAGARSDSIRDEQVRTLVQQLFFRPESGLVRNVGFTSVEASPQTALLCLDVARAVAAEGRVEVGLIDASFDAVPLERQLRIQSPAQSQVTWPVCSRVWLVPRRNWWCEGNSQTITDQDLAKLCEFMTEFDFSILHCASVSSLTARIGRRCDGLVLVLTANKTRRLAAAQVRDRLRKIQVPLLGTVLAERRFPVPEGLYRSL